MPDGEAMLRLAGVTKRYPGPAGAENPPVLRGLNLEVAAGESVAIVGPSGCGKTTLLNCIGTLDRPDEGQILLDGRDLTALKPAELAEIRNREIGFVFQLHHLLPQLTVWENVLLPTLACRNEVVRDGAEERARRLLKRVGLDHRLDYRPGRLSGGERQRAAVVRALINEPRLLLADEPTGALDRASAGELTRLLVELNREMGVTLIVVTHSLELARQMGRVLALRDGVLEPADLQP
ncbi:MAG: ABC transporter ATP-binding protein [Verrucomicrobia bacterium]|nr:MAG: ABC transporter ATP-binding protein [Verrucomicrobiota bacterium]